MPLSSLYRPINFFLAILTSSLQEIRQHKLRSFLSIIGVSIGTAAFMTLQFIGDSKEKDFADFLAEIGSRNVLYLYPLKPENANEVIEFARSPGLRDSDLDSLRMHVPEIKGIYNFHAKFRLYFAIKNETYSFGMIGISEDWVKSKYRLVCGRGINEMEFRKGAEVCMMTENIAQNIYKNGGPRPEQLLNRWLHLSEGVALRVIGIFSKDKTADSDYYHNALMVPIKYFRTHVDTFGYVDQSQARDLLLKNDADFDKVISDVEKYLTSLHRGVKDFAVKRPTWTEEYEKNVQNIRMTFSIIAGLALIIGALNIMNVMLTSVGARIREIGIRYAVGASSRQIFFQFLSEACILSCLGGFLGGLPLGWLCMTAAGPMFEATTMPDSILPYFLSGGLICMITGILAGILPAARAFRLRPAVALHYE